MSNFNSYSSDADNDIHICGRCRSEFCDIYQFIDHKKICSSSKAKIPALSIHRDSCSLDHDADHTNNHLSGASNQPNFKQSDPPTANASIQSLSNTKTIVVTDHYQIAQSSQIQQANLATALCSDHGITKPEINTVQYQYQTSDQSNSNSVLKGEETKTQYCYEDNTTTLNQQGSILKASNSSNLNSNALPLTLPSTACATSQDLLISNSTPGMGITSVTDNTVDSSALCPEDLEVGQISESMIGKLSQKFFPKGPDYLTNRKLNDSCSSSSSSSSKSNKRVGRLDPISTFTLKKKCNNRALDLNNSNTNKDSARQLSFSVNRINSSSAPLVAECEESPIDDLNLNRISFEKRERLQGVSDELLDHSPSIASATTTTLQSDNRVTSIRFQNLVDSSSSSSGPHDIHSTEHLSKPNNNNSVYKAVFTSPSSGGHRLSVNVDEGKNKMVSSLRYPPESSYSHVVNLDCKRDVVNNINIEKKNTSTSYKNISKLTDLSKNDNIVIDARGSEIVDGSVSFISSKPTQAAVYNTNNVKQSNSRGEFVQTSLSETIVKDNTNVSDQMNCPTINIHSNVMYDSSKEKSSNLIIGHNKIPSAIMQNPGAGVAQMETINIPLNSSNNSVIATEFSSWEPEEIQVIASSDQTNYLYLSGVEDNIKKEVTPLKSDRDEYGLEGAEDSIVLVYKREDGSFFMMCKQTQPNEEGSSNLFSSHAVPGSVLNDGVVFHEQQQGYQSVNHQVTTRQAGDCVDYKMVIQEKGMAVEDTQGQHVVHLFTEDKNKISTYNEKDSNLNEVKLHPPYKKDELVSTNQNIVYVQASGKTMMDEDGALQTVNIVSDNREMVNKQTHKANKVKRIIKGSSPRSVKEKSMKEVGLKPSLSLDVPLNPSVKCTTNQSIRVVKGSGSNKTYICHFGDCSYSTKLEKDFQRHYRRHTGEKPFKCDQCDKTFNRSDNFKIHLRCHAGQKPFQCKLCKYSTADNSSLKKHMRIHTDERPYQCQICPYASRNSSQLFVHLRTHTGDAPFHCNSCSAQFKLNSDLKRHLRIHTGEKPYACDQCDYRCSNKGNLKTHFRINHSSENEKPCPQCSFVSSSMKRLKEHIKIHDKARIIKCSVCQYTCNSIAALRSHMMVHNALRPFRCTFCPYSSKQSGNLKKHVQNVHNEKQRLTTLTSSSSLSASSSSKHSSLGITNLNSNNSTNKSNGKSRRTRNREDGSGGGDDNGCGAIGSISNKSDVYRPVRRTSSSRKIHVCPECGSGFVRHDSLRCHLKQHGEKNSSPKAGLKSPAVTTSTDDIEHDNSVPKSTSPSPPQETQHELPPPPQLQQQPPPPPPPLNYRSQGLESIVAAASLLYREQYMNGEDDDDGEVEAGDIIPSFSLESLSRKEVINSNTVSNNYNNSNNNSRVSQVRLNTNSTFNNNNSSNSNLPKLSGSEERNLNCNENNNFGNGNDRSSSVPNTIQQALSSPCTTTQIGDNIRKRQRSRGEGGQGKQVLMKKSKRSPSASKDSKRHTHSVSVSGVGNVSTTGGSRNKDSQVPWEHSSYTASNSTKTHPQSSSFSITSSSSRSSTQSVLSSSKTKRSKTHQTSSKSSSHSRHHQSQSSNNQSIINNNNNNSSTSSQLQSNYPHNQSYQYQEFVNVETSPQPISIQLLSPPMAGMQQHHASSTQMAPSKPQSVSNSSVSFQTQGSTVGQPTTALQILLPAGAQMTQIIQPPPLLPQPPPPQPHQQAQQLGQPLGQHQVITQPQIVFQVQEAAPPSSMTTTPVGGQIQHQQKMVLGQCATYGVIPNQVITAPADSTTMGGVYNVPDQQQRVVLNEAQTTDLLQALPVTSQVQS